MTIGEYRAFLEALELHAKNGRGRIYDHENQPAEKTGHLPGGLGGVAGGGPHPGTWQTAR